MHAYPLGVFREACISERSEHLLAVAYIVDELELASCAAEQAMHVSNPDLNVPIGSRCTAEFDAADL